MLVRAGLDVGHEIGVAVVHEGPSHRPSAPLNFSALGGTREIVYGKLPLVHPRDSCPS